MKKRIWIVNHYAGNMYLDCGGRHHSFTKHLKRAGYEPVIFCANSKHNAPGCYLELNRLWEERLAEEIGVPYVFIDARAYTGNGKQRILNMVDFYRNVKRVADEYTAQHGKPDVIYASSVHPLTLVAGIQLAKHFGVKCVCEVRDLWPESIVAYGIAGPKNPAVIALRWLEKWIYTHADAVVFTMEGAYDYIIEQGWEKEIPHSKVHYINNGVDLEVFSHNKEHFSLQDEDLQNPNTFNVVYAGSIRRVNNVGLLLDAAKQVTNPKVKFLIWGDGDELEKLEHRVKEEKISNVVFKGRVEKKYIPSIVSSADLNFAHNEASPLFRFGISFNKLFDYLAAGKPILCDFPCPYNPAVQSGAAISVECSNASTVAQTVEYISNMSLDSYTTMCKKAKEAAEEYDFKNLTKKLVTVIESIEKKE